jgi:hypothetical protein
LIQLNFLNRLDSGQCQTPVPKKDYLFTRIRFGLYSGFIGASDETQGFGAGCCFVASATIVAEMSRFHEIGVAQLFCLAALSTLGLALPCVSGLKIRREQQGDAQCEAMPAGLIDPSGNMGCSRLRLSPSWLDF